MTSIVEASDRPRCQRNHDMTPPDPPVNPVQPPTPPTPVYPPSQRLRAALRALRWPNTALAAETGASIRKVQSWVAGERDCPERVLAWLEGLARHLKENPLPGENRD